jgi:hypothetical protein
LKTKAKETEENVSVFPVSAFLYIVRLGLLWRKNKFLKQRGEM